MQHICLILDPSLELGSILARIYYGFASDWTHLRPYFKPNTEWVGLVQVKLPTTQTVEGSTQPPNLTPQLIPHPRWLAPTIVGAPFCVLLSITHPRI